MKSQKKSKKKNLFNQKTSSSLRNFKVYFKYLLTMRMPEKNLWNEGNLNSKILNKWNFRLSSKTLQIKNLIFVTEDPVFLLRQIVSTKARSYFKVHKNLYQLSYRNLKKGAKGC